MNSGNPANSNEPFFDRITDLANDPGMIGTALRELPEWKWLYPEADHWSNPWRFLLGCKDIPKAHQRLFEAGQSQGEAWRRIARIAGGLESMERSWPAELEEARKRRDTKRQAHAMKKIFAPFFRFDRGECLIKAAENISKPLADAVRKQCDAFFNKERRKHGRTKAEKINRPVVFKRETISARITWELASGWMRTGIGGPGYCFFGDCALMEFFAHLLHIHDLAFETVRKTRQFLRLKKAPVLIYRAQQNSDGSLRLLGSRGETIQTFHP